MLKHLTIKNYALIKHLEFEPSAQLNAVTGETGAGKSIMLGAIGLLMGNRADTKTLWDENEKCVTEGVFSIAEYKLKRIFTDEDLDYDDTTVIRREISPGGKSRAFINDTPVTLDVLRKISGLLLDVHSQHETLQLGNQDFQLRLIDSYAGNQKLVAAYHTAWSQFTAARRELDNLIQNAESLKQEADYVKFQLEELQKSDLGSVDQASLESELKVLEHTEEIKSRFNQLLTLLSRSEYAAPNAIREAKGHLQSIMSFSPAYATLHQRLESIGIELDDIVSEVEHIEESVEFDPVRAELLKEKLNTIYRLQKKHKISTVEELVQLQETLERKAEVTSDVDEAVRKATVAFQQSEKDLLKAGNQLTVSRTTVFSGLCKQLTKLLRDLGMPDATLTIQHQVCEPTASGIDDIEVLFSANKGIPPKGLSQVASGGEFSRLMFCVKYVMAEKMAMPTLILDEIDNGISGEIALKLGDMMKAMSAGHQVITITHLPQIAAKGDHHYYVFKNVENKKTVSSIRLLDDDERIEEIAKMIGGEKPSRAALENAQELLNG